MFLKFFYLGTNSKRITQFKRNIKTTKIKIYFLLQLKNKNLNYYKKNKAGRNIFKKIIINTKSSIKHKLKKILINYRFYIKKLVFISNFYFIPFQNKIVSLLTYNDGCATYINTTIIHKLFSYNYFKFFRINNKYFKIYKIWAVIGKIKKLSFISCFNQIPNQSYNFVRSSGTKSKLLNFNFDQKHCILILPSKKKLFISIFSSALLGANVFKWKKKFINTKAGFWRKYGINSNVRGVAMNPIDHPHGGRTKSIKYPRTPWGKTTKFK